MKEVIDSRRLDGLALQRTLSQAPRKQAAPLALDLLSALEHAVGSPTLAVASRILAGAALVLISLRSRYADGQHITKCVDEGDNIFASPSQTKTSGRNPDRLELTMLGPSLGVSGHPWFQDFEALRRQQQIPWGEYQLFPANQSDGWSKQPARFVYPNAQARYRHQWLM